MIKEAEGEQLTKEKVQDREEKTQRRESHQAERLPTREDTRMHSINYPSLICFIQLLIPHIRYIMEINIGGRTQLDSDSGIFSQVKRKWGHGSFISLQPPTIFTDSDHLV